MSEQHLLIQPKRDFLASAGPWADTLSKSVAGIAITLYACGFLIVSLYQSNFGFIRANPFRPRILAAGAWFFFFTAIPISIAARYRTRPWSKFAKDSAGLWVGCYGLSIPLGYILFDFSTPSTLPTKLSLSIALFGFAVFILLVVAANYSKVPNWVATTASVLLTLFYATDPTRRLLVNHEFEMGSLALWIVGCTALTIYEFKIRSHDIFASEDWSKALTVVFLVLLAFSQYVYPHLKASWGGGTPANVIVYFTKDSLLNPNKSVQAQLIEESDEGFYIVGPKESKAIFVPRNAVALVYFSDKAADSPMLPK